MRKQEEEEMRHPAERPVLQLHLNSTQQLSCQMSVGRTGGVTVLGTRVDK